jgi:large subunit ribosomal protein L10
MGKELKKLIVDELAARYTALDRCVVVNMSGISSLAASEIRTRLRAHHIDVKVVKNSMMAHAFRRIGLEKLVGLLGGPCAVVTGGEDVVELTKAVTELANQNRNIVIRGGYGEGLVLGSMDVRRFAAIPPRPVLIADFLSAALGPVRGLVVTLGGFTRNLVCVLDAVAKKRTPEPVAAPEASTTPEPVAAPEPAGDAPAQ